MDLTANSTENMNYMLKQIETKLQTVNAGALNAEKFDSSKYDEIRDIYEWVQKQASVSVREMEAIVSELGQLRKS
ncbi:DUF1128 domain-containing protein [Alkalicoccobacillus murimartini]|uniref:UPF0435 protein J2S05_001163 n=1 Tax=Alkalicoccobacillus murimartini TaxID=171685 RepID=A0ABT9YEX0_9BACI|nr:DUF1128 domain-containing protein [Alkalicoccobacillus murimartini]MDQ0206389.1 uncharacterized protein YfkK (UPF0435 family) [Alkalicoccobacillus murimartini]